MSDWSNNRRLFNGAYALLTPLRDGTWVARLHTSSKHYIWQEHNPTELAAKSSATREAKRLGLVEDEGVTLGANYAGRCNLHGPWKSNEVADCPECDAEDEGE